MRLISISLLFMISSHTRTLGLGQKVTRDVERSVETISFIKIQIILLHKIACVSDSLSAISPMIFCLSTTGTGQTENFLQSIHTDQKLSVCPLPVTDRQKTKTNSSYRVMDRQNLDQQLIESNRHTEIELNPDSNIFGQI